MIVYNENRKLPVGGNAHEHSDLRHEEMFDTKKAIRYFKERNVPFQFIDMKEKGMSKGEYRKVKQAAGGLDALLDSGCKDQDALALVRHLTEEQKDEKVLENQQILKTPIVRNGQKATVGYKPDLWKDWK